MSFNEDKRLPNIKFSEIDYEKVPKDLLQKINYNYYKVFIISTLLTMFSYDLTARLASRKKRLLIFLPFYFISQSIIFGNHYVTKLKTEIIANGINFGSIKKSPLKGEFSRPNKTI